MSPTATSTGTAARWLRWVTRASLVIGVVALAITMHVVGIDAIATHLQTIGPWFALLLVIEAAATCCDAGGVYWLSRGAGAPSYRKVLVAQFAGRAVNSVTPGGNVGEALKVSLLARECSTQRIIASVMMVALWGFIISLAVVAAGVLATSFAFGLPRAAEIALVVSGAGCAAVATVLVLLLRRGMLVTVADVARRFHLVSRDRCERWRGELAEIDARLSGRRTGPADKHRTIAFVLVLASQLMQRVLVAVTIVAMGFATGHALGLSQLVAILSAGLVLSWISTIIPLGVGISEGGNGALFAMIGAPMSLGVALALARRVNQIVFAAIGFGVLAADRLAHRGPPVEVEVAPVRELVTSP